MYDRVLVIAIKSYYSKVPGTSTAVLSRSTVPTTGNNIYCIAAVSYFAITLPITT